MTITSNSPIKGQTGTIFLNLPDNENKLFFTDSNSLFYYMVVAFDDETQLYKIIGYGILNGHPNLTDYDYRFNFDEYIRIPKLDMNNIVKVSNIHSYITGKNSTSVALCIGNENMLNDNISDSYIYQDINGEYYLYSGYEPTDLVRSYLFWYDFIDRKQSMSYFLSDKLIGDTTYAITLYGSSTFFFNIYWNGSNESGSLIKPANKDYIIGFWDVPKTVTKFEMYYVSSLPTIYPTTTTDCINQYCFMDTNGKFEILNLTGVRNDINTVNRNNIKVGNSIIVTKQDTVKQIVQNTGLRLTETQVLELINAPLVYTLTNTDGTFKSKEYILDNNSFNGYNGVKYGEKNIELTFTDPKSYKRITNKTISFFD